MKSRILPSAGQLKHVRVSRDPKSEIINRLRAAGMDRGFALVLGDSDGQLSVNLATHTALRVINALTDEKQVEALRGHLLATTPFYGSRIQVQNVERLDHLPFAQYFANAIVVANPLKDLSGKELYRLLRPYGGILLLPGLKPAEAEALVKQTGALSNEIRSSDGQSVVIRGKLPGARDWDTGLAQDKRVKWPLRPLWFGGPEPKLIMYEGTGQHSPVAANGRYFVMGEETLSAVDAYNGTVQWTRRLPTMSPDIRVVNGLRYPIADSLKTEYLQKMSILRRELGADSENVYLTLGKSYFRDQTRPASD